MKTCLQCGNETARSFYKYCSNKCQWSCQYERYINNWKHGILVRTRNIPAYIKRYLREKFKEQCSVCGWNSRNILTGRVPLEVDHIDGNSENNQEDNLRLICPNCHSLTPSFRNLNKGKGRKWRLIGIEKRKQK